VALATELLQKLNLVNNSIRLVLKPAIMCSLKIVHLSKTCQRYILKYLHTFYNVHMVGAINLSTDPQKMHRMDNCKKKYKAKLIYVQHEASMKLSHIMQVTSHTLLIREFYTCHVNDKTALQPMPSLKVVSAIYHSTSSFSTIILPLHFIIL